MVCTIMFIFQYNQKAFQGQIGLSDLSIIKFYMFIFHNILKPSRIKFVIAAVLRKQYKGPGLLKHRGTDLSNMHMQYIMHAMHSGTCCSQEAETGGLL